MLQPRRSVNARNLFCNLLRNEFALQVARRIAQGQACPQTLKSSDENWEFSSFGFIRVRVHRNQLLEVKQEVRAPNTVPVRNGIDSRLFCKLLQKFLLLI